MLLPQYWLGGLNVALLAEGVDRNNETWFREMPIYVALLAEGVDRNDCFHPF